MKLYRRTSWILVGVALLINLCIGYHVYSNDNNAEAESDALEKLTIMMRVMHLIRQDYVDGERTDFSDLIDAAIQGMVSNLDPHSSYLEPPEYQDMIEMTEGEFGGIGIIVTVRDGVLTIVSPIEDTPGSRAGLRAGDMILEVDGEATQDMSLQDAVHMMKGEPGTDVDVLIYRPDDDENIEVTITRALIEVASIKGTRILTNEVGYVRVVQFDENAAANLGEALEELKDKGASSLVLDLRNNPGGLLAGAVQMCSYFLPEQKLVVSTEGRRPSQKQEFYTVPQATRFEGPVAILVNGGSASAAEIVAGCLKDHERAMLVGEKTFGKGSVQNVIPLPDDSALRLTTAMYYTPSRRVIHENGIEPDIEVVVDRETMKDMQEARYEQLENDEDADYQIDPQLKRAVETLQSYSRYQETVAK